MAAFLALVTLSSFGVGVGLGWCSLPTGLDAAPPTAPRSRPEPAVMRLIVRQPYDWEGEG